MKFPGALFTALSLVLLPCFVRVPELNFNYLPGTQNSHALRDQIRAEKKRLALNIFNKKLKIDKRFRSLQKGGVKWRVSVFI